MSVTASIGSAMAVAVLPRERTRSPRDLGEAYPKIRDHHRPARVVLIGDIDPLLDSHVVLGPQRLPEVLAGDRDQPACTSGQSPGSSR